MALRAESVGIPEGRYPSCRTRFACMADLTNVANGLPPLVLPVGLRASLGLLQCRPRPTFVDFGLVCLGIEVSEHLEHFFLRHGYPLFVSVESGLHRPDHGL